MWRILFSVAVAVLSMASARTRYEEFDLLSCRRAPFEDVAVAAESDTIAKPSIGEQLSGRREPACTQFCASKSYPHGGCDCETKKCVCVNMDLDFCRFQEIRILI